MSKIHKLILILVTGLMLILCVIAVSACDVSQEEPINIPKNLVLDSQDILSWDAVDGADFYIVNVGEEKYETTETQLDLFEVLVNPGEITISVTAFRNQLPLETFDITHTVQDSLSMVCFAFINNNTAYKIKAIDSTTISGKIVIPETVNGLPVKEISEYAFRQCKKITGVIIPDSITKVSKGAFLQCTSLTRVRWSDNAALIGKLCFYGCTSLKEFVMPDTVLSTGSNAFTGCTSLTYVRCSANLKTFNTDFENCSALNKLELPEGIEVFASSLKGCDSLKELNFPSSLSAISVNTIIYLMCPNIEIITVAEGNPKFKAEGNCLIDIANNSVVLGACKSVIPEYVTKIDKFAFATRNIEEIYIPANVEEIGIGIFKYCHKLTSVEVDSNNAYYKSDENCIISKKDNVLVAGCEESTIPSYVTKIGAYSFAGSEIQNVIIPYGCTEIEHNAFEFCKNLKKVAFPRGLQTIGASAFERSGAFSVTLPESLTTIGSCAFGTEFYTVSEDNSDKVKYASAVYSPFETDPVGWDYDWMNAGNMATEIYYAQPIRNCEIAYEDNYPYVKSCKEYSVARNPKRCLVLPKRDGYEFLGWSAQINATEPDSTNRIEIFESTRFCYFTEEWYAIIDETESYPIIYAVWKKSD